MLIFFHGCFDVWLYLRGFFRRITNNAVMRLTTGLIIFGILLIALKYLLGRVIQHSLSSSATSVPGRTMAACVKFYQACKEFYRNIDSGAVLRVKLYFLIS